MYILNVHKMCTDNVHTVAVFHSEKCTYQLCTISAESRCTKRTRQVVLVHKYTRRETKDTYLFIHRVYTYVCTIAVMLCTQRIHI